MQRALMWLNLYGCQAVRRKLKKWVKMHFWAPTNSRDKMPVESAPNMRISCDYWLFLKTKLLIFNITLWCHNSKLSYSSLCLLYYSAYYILLGHQHARNNQTKRVMDDGLFLHLAELYQHRLVKCSVWPWLSCDWVLFFLLLT